LRTAQFEEYITGKESVCRNNDTIARRLYDEYGVKKGLRDENGNGVLAGLTNISKIVSSKFVEGQKVSCDGQLWYRGYRVEDLLNSLGENELGYEKIAYLLLMGEMPSDKEHLEFKKLIGECRTLPSNFARDVIMKASSSDIMNSMTRSILTLASYDDRATDTGVSNALRQCIELISEFPLLAVYGYHAFNYSENMDSMIIHRPDPSLSTAENFLMMLRPDKKYTATEAKVLDTALILHMEHTLLFDIDGFKKMMKFIIITYSVTILVYFVFPTCQNLRPPEFARDNIFTRFLEGFYQFDTNTNVCPSIHVIGTMAVVFAGFHSKHLKALPWKLFFSITGLLICMSTVMLKQHSILDVFAAILVCTLGYILSYKIKPRDSKISSSSKSPDLMGIRQTRYS